MEINKEIIKKPKRDNEENEEIEEAPKPEPPKQNKGVEQNTPEVLATESVEITTEGIRVFSSVHNSHYLAGIVVQLLKTSEVQRFLDIDKSKPDTKIKKKNGYIN